MSSFDNSRWADTSFSQEYRDKADGYIPERRTLVEIAGSLYRHLVKTAGPRRVLDLGCGDGFMVQELLKLDRDMDVTLVDGSRDMLDAACMRLAHLQKKQCVHASFQELLSNDPLPSKYGFVLSSLAIHHLVMADKESFFEYVYRHLDAGGFFLNIDVVLSPTDALEEWYLQLWQRWIETHSADSQKASLLPVPKKYKENLDNLPDPLSPQLRALERLGFKNVDCFYKYGIFAMFGGSRDK